MTWTTAPLSKIATIERNSISPADIKSGSRYVGLDHIESGGGSIRFGSVENGELASNKFRFGPNHILFGKLRPYLAKVVCPDFVGICSTDIMPIMPSKHVDKRYLLHFLRRPETIAWAAGRATGVNLPRLSPKELASLEIPHPRLEEQQHIAAILDKADALRHKRKRAIDLLGNLTQSIFLGMFGDLVESCAYPRGTVSDWVADFDTGKNLAPDPDARQINGYRVLKVSAVTKGIFLPDESKPLPIGYEPPTSHIIKKGDLLFSRANTAELIGATAYVESAHHKLVLPDKIWRFVWREKNSPNPRFVHALFSTPSFRRALTMRASGTSGSMKNISKPKVLGIEIALPSRKQQDEFGDRYLVIQNNMSTSILQAAMLEDQFSSLQSRAFSGQL